MVQQEQIQSKFKKTLDEITIRLEKTKQDKEAPILKLLINKQQIIMDLYQDLLLKYEELQKKFIK